MNVIKNPQTVIEGKDQRILYHIYSLRVNLKSEKYNTGCFCQN